jgi:hypothetical protein
VTGGCRSLAMQETMVKDGQVSASRQGTQYIKTNGGES